MTKYVKVAVTTQYNIIRGVKPYRDTDYLYSARSVQYILQEYTAENRKQC